jgi:hypothetical protein
VVGGGVVVGVAEVVGVGPLIQKYAAAAKSYIYI